MLSRGTRRPAGGTVPLLVASGLTVLALAACGSSGTDSASGPSGSDAGSGAVTVRTDFADGVPPHWEARRASVEHGSGADGPPSWVRLDAAGAPAYASLPPAALASDRHHFAFAGRFRVRSRATDQTVGLATVANSAHEHHADLFVDRTSGRCRVDLFEDDTAMSPIPCDDGSWHRVTMRGDFGSSAYALSWTLDGVTMPSIRSTAQPPATVHRLWLGDATPDKTNVTDWTDVSLTLT